jgi:hypothetical protein
MQLDKSQCIETRFATTGFKFITEQNSTEQEFLLISTSIDDRLKVLTVYESASLLCRLTKTVVKTIPASIQVRHYDKDVDLLNPFLPR